MQPQKPSSSHYTIAGHHVRITMQDGTAAARLLPAFEPFSGGDGEVWLDMDIDDSLRPATQKQLVRDFDTGNGHTKVWSLPDGGHQFIVKDPAGRSCALLIASADFSRCRCALAVDAAMRAYGLYDAIMLAYAFRGSFCATVLIHASTILYKGRAYPFSAKSGTGKSTHANQWMRCIDGATLLNDDNPIIRIEDGQPIVYGSPWSGKTPCYRNISAPLGALTKIERAAANSIERLGTIDALKTLLENCSTMKWERDIYAGTISTIERIIARTPLYTLHCLPDEEAARLCQRTIAP